MRRATVTETQHYNGTTELRDRTGAAACLHMRHWNCVEMEPDLLFVKATKLHYRMTTIYR
jgi:hypothetical protein